MSGIKVFAAGSVVGGTLGGVGLATYGGGAALGELGLAGGGEVIGSNVAGPIIGWGTSNVAADVAATEELTANLTEDAVEKMAEKGLTKSTVQRLLFKYSEALENGGPTKLANKQLLPRYQLMVKILQLWPKWGPMQILTRLIDHWSRQGIRLRPGLRTEELTRFERQRNVRFPTEFRDYLETANGMDIGPLNDQDSEGFCFWPIEEMKSVPDELSRLGHALPNVSEVDSFWAFADYMQWSWAYAIGTSAAQGGRILHIGVDEPRIIAESFGAFIELYLANSPLIYPPVPKR